MRLKNKYDLNKILASQNIAEMLEPEDLKIIGHVVCEEYDMDDETRTAWKDMNYEAMKLALQIPEPKTSPWPGASNVKFPLLTVAAQAFQSRAYPALVTSPELVKCQVIGDDPTGQLDQQASRVGTYMSYQFLEESDNWDEDTDRLTMILPIVGCVVRKTYWEPIEKKMCSETVMPQDFVVSYYTKTIEDCRRATCRLEQSLRQVKEKQISGFYVDVELKESTDSIESAESAALKNDRGFIEPEGDPEKPRLVLEQHRFLDLDGDGYFEPYVVTVDEPSEKVLRIFSRFSATQISRNTDGQVASIKNQMQQIMSPPVNPAMSTEQAQTEISIRKQQITAMGQEITRLQKTSKIVYIEAINYFTKYSFLPSPDGSFYDIGFGALLSPINHSVNTAINQLFDAGTLMNSSMGFISENVRLKGNDYRFRPFEWKRAATGAGNLKDGLVPLPINQPSSVIFQLLELLINYAERLSSVTDMMVGETPGQNTPATTSMAALDQGLKVYTGILKRLYRAEKQEFRKVYKLNRLYLDPVKYFAALNVPQQAQGVIYQQDFQGDESSICPQADPSIASDAQRIQRAQFLAQRSATVPGYNQQLVELYLLKEMKVPDIDQLYPTNPPIQPPQNPQLELEVAEAHRKTVETQTKLQLQGMETMAKVENLRAQAIQFIANAKHLGTETDLGTFDRILSSFDSVHDALSNMMGHANDAQANQNQQDQLEQQAQEAQQNESGGTNGGAS